MVLPANRKADRPSGDLFDQGDVSPRATRLPGTAALVHCQEALGPPYGGNGCASRHAAAFSTIVPLPANMERRQS